MISKRTSASEDQPAPPSERPAWLVRLPRVTAFVAFAGLVIAYALPGGAYDVVVRQEYGIVIWWLVGLGFVTGVLPRNLPGRFGLLFVLALAAYAGWTALSLGWTQSAERTTAEIARVLDYLGLVVLIGSVLDRATWRTAAMGLAFGAMVVCVLVLLSRLYPGSFPASTLVRPHVNNRLSYPFGYWNAVGAWGSMSIAAGIAWSTHESSRLRRAAALGLVPVATAVTYLTYSRAAVASSVVGVALVFGLSRYRVAAFVHILTAAAAGAIVIAVIRANPAISTGAGGAGSGSVLGATVLAMAMAGGVAAATRSDGINRARLSRRWARTVATVTTAVVVLVAAGLGPNAASKAWHQFRHQNNGPAVTADAASRLTQLSGSRYSVWNVSMKAFDAKPFNGVGAGSFEFWWDRHGTDGEFVRNAHSFEFENMAELGMPGLVLIVAVFGSALAILIRLRTAVRRTISAGASVALLSGFVVFLMQASVDWIWQSTAVTVLALAGVAVSAARLSSPRGPLHWAWRVGAALAAAGAIWLQLPGLLSTADIRQSQAAERAGRADLALSWANDAVSDEPWSATAYEQRGLVLEAAGQFPAAAQDLNRAITHERTNFRHWLIMARIEVEQHHFGAAADDYLKARHLRPKAYVFAFAPYLAIVAPAP